MSFFNIFKKHVEAAPADPEQSVAAPAAEKMEEKPEEEKKPENPSESIDSRTAEEMEKELQESIDKAA